MVQILVIDDDTELCELLQDYLTSEEFDVTAVHRGDAGADLVEQQSFDLVILDVMLPGMNGFDVLRRIRNHSRVPVIMLTARGEEVDRIVGLELGADDYLPKPFNPRELTARMRAVLRRHGDAPSSAPEKSVSEYQIGDIHLCTANRTVKKDGHPVELTSVEFSLLQALLAHAGEIISREELVAQVLGRQLSAYDRSIDVHVSALRKKLGHSYRGTERIRTVRGIGYLYSLSED